LRGTALSFRRLLGYPMSVSDVPLKSYATLQKTFAADIGGAANRKQLGIYDLAQFTPKI
jgi:hypothetical protein